MGKKSKSNFGKRLSQFLTKIFWHLNQQSTPTYTYPYFNSKCFSKKTSARISSANRFYKKNLIDRYSIRDQYPAIYRTCSFRERKSTLSSIQEE